MFPSLFISHGAPTLALDPSRARDFVAGLGETLGRPRAILVASAHWETAEPRVSAPAVNETIHDFRGFPARLHDMRYPAPGMGEAAGRAAELLQVAGFSARIDPARGLDHGAWVPLSLMYPDADIPVGQVSIQPEAGPAHHMALGRALAPLRDDGVLIVGSGSFTHDLRRAFAHAPDDPAPPDVNAFAAWCVAALEAGLTADLLAYRDRAPAAATNHPTEEHLLPLFVALGAGGATVEHLHTSATYGVLRMDAFAFR